MMKIAYIGALMGGHDALRVLLDEGISVNFVFTLDERYAENVSCFQSFDDLFIKYKLPHLKVRDINDSGSIQRMRELAPSLIIVNCWSQMIGKEILSIPPLGILGMHPTLLPLHRGRAPIPWALINGLDKTGVTWFFYKEQPDAGDIVMQQEIPITLEDTAFTLGKKIDEVSTRLLIACVKSINAGTYQRIHQDETKATYWKRRRPEDGIIDWHKNNLQLYNWIRGLTYPYPGAFTYYKGEKIMVWSATFSQETSMGKPGQIIHLGDGGLVVGTGKGSLLLTHIQEEKGHSYHGKDIKNAGFTVGDVLGT